MSRSKCGWKVPRSRRSIDRHPLSIGGKVYPHGVGTHADGVIQIQLKGGCSRFTSLVGVDDEVGNAGSVEFIVETDNKTILWRSGIMRGGDAPKKIDIDIWGRENLWLKVTAAGDNIISDHADWAMARIEYVDEIPLIVFPGTPLKRFSDAVGADAVEIADPDILENDWHNQYLDLERIDPKKYHFPQKQVLNRHAMKWESDKNPVETGIRRLEALITHLKESEQAPDLGGAEKALAAIKAKPATPERYLELRKVMRKVILSNPLLDFDSILFVVRGSRCDLSVGIDYYNGDHLCDQYYGHNGRKGGGLFILKNWKSGNPELVDLVKGLRVPSGRNMGKLLNEGTFISPELSWDGKTVLFAWSSGGSRKWDPMNRFSIFRVDVDGSNLQRLRDTPYDEFDPAWLPNDRIVFVSSMRQGFGRCHARPVPVYTLFSMKADGSDCFPINYHETNEFHPSVDNNGMIIYTRWDYVDRDHNAAHHIWHCAPDGRDPRSYHGNYALPLSTMNGSRFSSGLRLRPWGEFNCRAIPGSSKYIATAGPHHGQSFGSLVMIDIHVPDDNMMSQVKRITPDALFPEGEWPYHWADVRIRGLMPYGTAWPLSESFYLCNYNQSLCILDEFGNREMICRVTNGMRPLDPIPLRARKRPPIIPCKTWQGERRTPDAPLATIGVMDVKITDDYAKAPAGSEIKALRVVQVLPKSTPLSDCPRIGYANQSLARIPLGAVPVESDGSVYFRAPVGKAIYFQLLDKNGMAVQSMRSVTYVHPGERLTCLGCHEKKNESTQGRRMPLAMRRAPSVLKPEIGDHVMFNFYRHVQPILESKCVSCHSTLQKKQVKCDGPVKADYLSLKPYAFYLGHGHTNPKHGGSRTLPGQFGALGSRMGRALLGPGHQKLLAGGKVTPEEFRTICMWLDLNSNQFSDYRDTKKQRKGEIVWPLYDVDPKNYTGVERR